MFIFEFNHLHWLFTVSQGMKANIKISQVCDLDFQDAKVRVCDWGQNLKMTKTS